MSTFFGLGRNYRPVLHAEIHDLVFHGNGGFTHERVYHMPVWLRRFHIRKINQHFEEQRKAQENNAPKGGPSRPGITQ
jgi:hypothetical protein